MPSRCCVQGRTRSASRCGCGSIPDGPDAERACCSPEAVIAARETCHRLGLPHVTLDLREEFRRAVVDAVRPRLRARRDAEPVHPLQRRLPLRASCSRSPRAPAAIGSRRATTRASPSIAAGVLLARGADPQKDQSYMLARARPAAARPHLVPARRAGQGRRRARRPRAPGSTPRSAPRARRRASSPATTTAAFLTRHGLEPRTGRDRRRGRARRSATHDGFWRFTPGQRKGIGVVAARPLYVLDADAATNTVVVGPREALARTHVSARRDACTSTSIAPTRSSAIARRPVGAERPRAPRRLRRSSSTSRRTASRRGQAAVLYEGDAVVGCGLVSSGVDN